MPSYYTTLTIVDDKALYGDGRLLDDNISTFNLLKIAQPGFRYFKEVKSKDKKYPKALEDVKLEELPS